MADLALPRVVFTPTSSGDLTLAEARVALLSWLIAKKAGGTLVIRLDDFVGGVEGVAARLERALSWLGLEAQEGPARGGPFGPYTQAARHEIYAHYAEKLLGEQAAFRCFCTPNHLPPDADSSGDRCTAGCARLSSDRVEDLLRKGAPWVLRLRGQAGEVLLDDPVRGQISLRAETAGDPVLVSANGFPTAPFRAAVDDALMFISHVVREEAALAFTLRQQLICRALDLESPQVAHLPALRTAPEGILAPEPAQVTIDTLRREGYLPGGVVGFLAQLAGMDAGHLTVERGEELIPEFDPQRLRREAPLLDLEALRAESRRRLLKLRDEELRAALRPFLAKAGLAEDDPRLPRLVALFREWAVTVGELAQKLSLFSRDPAPVMDRAAVKYLRRESSQKVLWSFVRQLRSQRELNQEVLTRLMSRVRQETGMLGRDLYAPVRIALTGDADGPPLSEVVELLGKAHAVKLIERSLGEKT